MKKAMDAYNYICAETLSAHDCLYILERRRNQDELMKHRYYKDPYGYLLETSRSWATGDGRGDAVARTVLAAIVYRDQEFIDAIKTNLYSLLYHGQWKPIRHPEEHRTEDFSRDHTIWYVIWMRYFSIISRALDIPWKISDKFNQTIDMWLWIRAVAKDRFIDRFAYWIVAGLLMRIGSIWNRWLRNRAGIESVHYLDFKPTPAEYLNKKELFACKNSAPGYIMDTQAFMIHCLSDGWFKRRLKKRLIPLVEKSNYLIRKLAGDVFSAEDSQEINNYTGMDGFRWARRLDRTTDIELNQLTGKQPPWNMDRDVLKANLEWL
ncbi:hypothetical protein LCGC14_2962740 [marine sediment metagenome]|uniref:Uncharacterized protein n=1 Tax=marine sediment metagenome TaxID=412755 RepID=A0A0F8ZJI6_9ZZZZ